MEVDKPGVDEMVVDKARVDKDKLGCHQSVPLNCTFKYNFGL